MKTVKSLILFCCALALAGVFSSVRTAVAHEGTMAKDVTGATDDMERRESVGEVRERRGIPLADCQHS